ncbi:MAG: hypothetical protein ABH971_02555 [bacterium]
MINFKQNENSYRTRKIIISITIILIIIILMVLVFDWGRKENKNFEKLSEINFQEATLNSTSSMSIIVNYPVDNQEVSNPIKIEGKAKRDWFFEKIGSGAFFWSSNPSKSLVELKLINNFFNPIIVTKRNIFIY